MNAATPLEMPNLADFAVSEFNLQQFDSASIDLDIDGRDEHILLARQPEFCGTGGCTLFIVVETDEGFAQIGRIPAVQGPVRLLDSNTNGWRDLGFVVRFDAMRHLYGEITHTGPGYQKHETDRPVDWGKPFDGELLFER